MTRRAACTPGSSPHFRACNGALTRRAASQLATAPRGSHSGALTRRAASQLATAPRSSHSGALTPRAASLA